MVTAHTEVFRAQCGWKREQVIPKFGFRIILPEDFAFFKETVQALPPANNENKPYNLGFCKFPIPVPIGRVSMDMLRSDKGVIFLASICPSWTRAEQIISFAQREKILKTQLSDDRIGVIGRNILMEVLVSEGDLKAFPLFGETIVVKTEEIPLRPEEDANRLYTALNDINYCVRQIVDSAFAMTGKPCPLGKAISLEFPH